MGGKGSGRLNKTDAFLKKNSDPFKSVGNVASVGDEVLVIPNNSGMEDYSRKRAAFWSQLEAQTGLTGDKTGSFNLTTTGLITTGVEDGTLGLAVKGIQTIDAGEITGSVLTITGESVDFGVGVQTVMDFTLVNTGTKTGVFVMNGKVTNESNDNLILRGINMTTIGAATAVTGNQTRLGASYTIKSPDSLISPDGDWLVSGDQNEKGVDIRFDNLILAPSIATGSDYIRTGFEVTETLIFITDSNTGSINDYTSYGYRFIAPTVISEAGISGSINRYAFWANGGMNYFEGDTGIGTATPQEKLSVNGNIVLPKASGKGIKVDLTTPTFGFRDILGDQFSKNTGATKPILTAYNGVINAWKFEADDEAYFTYHIPHDYVAGSPIFLHVHWSHNETNVTGGTVTFKLTSILAKAHNQQPFQSSPSVGTFTGTASTVQYQQILSEVLYSDGTPTGLEIDTANLEPDSVIEMTFELDANDITISGGSQPDPFIHFVDIHYQSTNIATKDKAPNFYT